MLCRQHLYTADCVRYLLCEQWQVQSVVHRLALQLRQRNDRLRADDDQPERDNSVPAGAAVHLDVLGESGESPPAWRQLSQIDSL